MKSFAAVALLAIVATAESDECKAWLAAVGSAYDCYAGTCKAKDPNASQAVIDAEDTVSQAYRQVCGDDNANDVAKAIQAEIEQIFGGATANYVAVGSLAVAAATLAF